MKKLMNGLLIALAVVLLSGLILSALYTQTVSDELTRLRRESRSDIVYLRTRIRELESELTESLLLAFPPSQNVGGTGETETGTDSDADSDESLTEAVTVPTHQAPETQSPTLEIPETEALAAAYLLTEHNGMIGVFDASGELLKTVNVFVMTLPEAEREALEVGIPAYSYEEMCKLAERYE